MDRERNRSTNFGFFNTFPCMKKRIKFLIEYFGFSGRTRPEAKYPFDLIIEDNLSEKLDYLKALDQQEATRLSTIESKLSQLVGQTGIMLTLLGLFISNYLGKAAAWPSYFKFALIIFFFICLFFYLATVYQATKHFNIINYRYGQRDASTVKKKFGSKESFQLEELKDLMYSIEQNTGLNNSKGDDLMYSYRSFQIGTFLGAVLILILISTSFISIKGESTKVNIENAVRIEGLDSFKNVLQLELKKSRMQPIIPRDTCQ